jgi:hypothetical protein
MSHSDQILPKPGERCLEPTRFQLILVGMGKRVRAPGQAGAIQPVKVRPR